LSDTAEFQRKGAILDGFIWRNHAWINNSFAFCAVWFMVFSSEIDALWLYKDKSLNLMGNFSDVKMILHKMARQVFWIFNGSDLFAFLSIFFFGIQVFSFNFITFDLIMINEIQRFCKLPKMKCWKQFSVWFFHLSLSFWLIVFIGF
jgi:hypothetical protein